MVSDDPEGGDGTPDPPDPPEPTPMQKDGLDQSKADTDNALFHAKASGAAQDLGYNPSDSDFDSAAAARDNARFVTPEAINALIVASGGTNDGTGGLTVVDPATGNITIYIQGQMGSASIAAALDHEYIHALLDHAVLSGGGNPGAKGEDERQHDVICGGLGLRFCGDQFCGESTSCGSCAPGSQLMHDLLSCTPTSNTLVPIPRGAGVIDPSPESNPTSSAWAACFAGSMLPQIPTICLALDCPNNIAAVLNQQAFTVLGANRCKCTTGSGIVPMPSIIQCGTLHCPEDSMPAPTRLGCGCQPFGSDPVIPAPVGCTLCSRAPDPMLQQCPALPVAQREMCFFQNPAP